MNDMRRCSAALADEYELTHKGSFGKAQINQSGDHRNQLES